MTKEIPSDDYFIVTDELSFNAKIKGNIMEVSSKTSDTVENPKTVRVYLFSEDDATAINNFRQKMYSSQEAFDEVNSHLPERFRLELKL